MTEQKTYHDPFTKLYGLLAKETQSITMNCKAIAPLLDINHKYLFMLLKDPSQASEVLTRRAWKQYFSLARPKHKPAITVRYDDEDLKEEHLQNLTNDDRIKAFSQYLEEKRRSERIWNRISQALEQDI